MKRKAEKKSAAPGKQPEHTDAGLINDEYSDASFVDPNRVDALDMPSLLDDEDALDEVPVSRDGIEEVQSSADAERESAQSTADDGHVLLNDGNEMGVGTELYSVDDLERATVGAPRKRRRHPRNSNPGLDS
jgi:hypothetical protein